MDLQEEIFELYAPKIGDKYNEMFLNLISKLEKAFPHHRSKVIKNEIENGNWNDDDLENVKYKTSLLVLIDLLSQGWELEIKDKNIYLKMTSRNSVDKNYIRYRLGSEKKAQLNEESVIKFVSSMEKSREYQGRTISVKNLIGDKDILISRIKSQNCKIVDPYVQLVTKERDELTGYKLSDIWRYFRYTWSIPYKTMPGRNLFYLVRDASQPYHPVIGIFALGNSVLNLTVRDDDIGWTLDALKKQMSRKVQKQCYEETISGTNGKKVITKKESYLESEDEYIARITPLSKEIITNLQRNIRNAIDDVYVKDLGYHRKTKYPKSEYIEELKRLAEELRLMAIDNEKTKDVKDYKAEAQTILFKKKRAIELSRLLEAMNTFNKFSNEDFCVWLQEMLKSDEGKKSINVALVANRKTKIGSNMMEIIVCGSIPPYNELLGGKLVSILACCPQVIRDYNERYEKQVSEIASRMKGKKVIRDNRLAFLGTTSLYSVGSSQYNRIKVPVTKNFTLEYKKVGITEGYGTVYFSKATTTSMMRVCELIDGGRRINNIFGEGTSPRFRLISKGLAAIGIKSEAFLQHYSPRIVYSIDLVANTKEFLRGETKELLYPFDINNENDIELVTQRFIDFWYKRWLEKRITTVDIISRLEEFDSDSIVVGLMR